MLFRAIKSMYSIQVFPIKYLPYNFCEIKQQSSQHRSQQLQQLKSPQQFNKIILSCLKYNDVINSITKYKIQLKQQHWKLISQKLNALKHTQKISDTYFYLNLKFKSLNLQTCENKIPIYLAQIIITIHQFQPFNYSLLLTLCNKINPLLLNPENVFTNEQIISFYQLSYITFHKQLISTTSKQLLKRINTLTYKQLNKYITFAYTRKIPTKNEKQIFNKIMIQLKSKIESKKEIKIPLNIYISLKKINKISYSQNNKFILQDIVKFLQNKIKNQIDQFQEKQIMVIANFKSELNMFSRVIFTKVINSINDKGQSAIQSTSLLKLLLKLAQNQALKIGRNQRQGRFMKFIQKNIHQTQLISALIKKNFFSRTQLAQICKYITSSSSDSKVSLKNPSFIYQFIVRGIIPNNYISIFLTDKQKYLLLKPQLNQHFLYLSLTIQKLANQNPQNGQLKQLKNHFIKSFQQLKQGQFKFRFLSFFVKSKLIQYFHRRFSYLYINTVIKQIIQKKQRLQPGFLIYSIYSSDFRNFYKILKSKNFELQLFSLKLLIQKINTYPTFFTGTYDFIFRLLNTIIIKQQLHKLLITLTCNWQIHLLLTPDQLDQFLKLSIKIIKQSLFVLNSSRSYISYFISSPNHHIQNHLQYLQFFKQFQNRVSTLYHTHNKNIASNQNIKTNETLTPDITATSNPNETIPSNPSITPDSPNQLTSQGQSLSNSQSPSQNKQFFINFYQAINNPIAYQLLSYNMMTKQYAKIYVEKTKQSSHITQYAQLITGKKLDWSKIQLKVNNITLYVRNTQFTQQQISQLIPKIKALLNQCSMKQLQNILLNYQLKKCVKSFELLISILDNYTSKIKQMKQHQKNKYFLIVHSLESNHIFHLSYKNYLTQLMSYYIKHIFKQPIQSIAFLFNHCLSSGIQCRQHSSRLINITQQRSSRIEFYNYHILTFIENLVLIDPQQASKLYNHVVRHSSRGKNLQRLLSNLYIIDPSDAKYANQLKKLMKNLQTIPIYQSIYKYLTMKNIAFQQFSKKVVFKPYLENTQLKFKLIKFLGTNKIPYILQQKYGHSLIKLSKKRILFSHKNFNTLLAAKLKQFFSAIFNIPYDQSKQLIILFSGMKNRNNKAINLLKSQVQQFKSFPESLQQIFKQKPQKPEQLQLQKQSSLLKQQLYQTTQPLQKQIYHQQMPSSSTIQIQQEAIQIQVIDHADKQKSK